MKLFDMVGVHPQFIKATTFSFCLKQYNQTQEKIIQAFKNRKSLYAFNKKALYVLIRERSNIPMTNTNRITKIVKIFKDDFDLQFNKYMKK